MSLHAAAEAVFGAAEAGDHVGRTAKAAELDHLGAAGVGAEAQIAGGLDVLLEIEILVARVVLGPREG